MTNDLKCDACNEDPEVAEVQPAKWLMGEETSRSLSWPFLCEVHRQEEIAAIQNGESGWETTDIITWWDIETQEYGEPTRVPDTATSQEAQ